MADMLPIIAGFLVMVSYGISDIIAKNLSKGIEQKKIIFYRGIFITLIYLPLLFFFTTKENLSITYILLMIAIAFLGFLGLKSFYKALGYGKLGIVVPIAGINTIITVILSVILFSETFTAMHFFVLILIFIGFLMISLNFRQLRNSQLFNIRSGIPNALFTCIMWGIVYTLFKYPVGILGPILTSLILELFISIYMGIENKAKSISFSINKTEAKNIFFLALCGASATFFYMLGINNGNVSTVALVVSATPIIPALYGRFIHKDRLSLAQNIGLLSVIIGLLLITQI